MDARYIETEIQQEEVNKFCRENRISRHASSTDSKSFQWLPAKLKANDFKACQTDILKEGSKRWGDNTEYRRNEKERIEPNSVQGREQRSECQ